MRTRPSRLLPGLLLLFALPSLAASNDSTGVIEGTVTSECHSPVGYATVVLLGSRLGAQTDSLGRYRISGVPAGAQMVRIMWPWISDAPCRVTVVEGDTTRFDAMVSTRRHAPTHVEPAPPSPPRCEVHGSSLVLVHVPVSIGLRAETGRYFSALRDTFPHGEGVYDGGCTPTGFWDAWTYLCRECIHARNQWRGVEETDFRSELEGADWVSYSVSGGIQFRAPAGAETTMQHSGCVEARTWRWHGLFVSTWLGPWRDLPRLTWSRDPFHGEIVDSEYVNVRRIRGPGKAESVRCEVVLAGGDDTLRFEVTQLAAPDVPRMLAILRSLRFQRG